MKFSLYKIFTLIIVIIAYIVVIYKLATYNEYTTLFEQFAANFTTNWYFLVACLMLMPCNMLTEALKWQCAVSHIESISLKKAIISTLRGQVGGIATPNKLGDIPTRALSLHEGNKASGIIMLISYLPMFLFMPFIKKIVNKFGKKEACAVGSAVSLFGAALLFLPLGNGGAGLIGYIIAQVFFGLGLGFYTCVSWALMADAIDYNEWKNHSKEEGTVYSLHSFFRKLAQGVGPSAVIFIMGVLGYVEELGTIGQSPETAKNMSAIPTANCWLPIL